MIRSGRLFIFSNSFILLDIISRIEPKSSIFHSLKVLILNFLYLELLLFQFSIILRLATV